MQIESHDGKIFDVEETTQNYTFFFAHKVIHSNGEEVEIGKDIKLVPNKQEERINKIFQFFRKNETIPSPCSYYEEDNYLLGCLWQLAERLDKELKIKTEKGTL